MPEVWRVRYTLNSTLLQDVTFPSKNEAMNYVTETFPAHVRAPNAEWESLVTRGICQLSGDGVITVECDFNMSEPVSFKPQPRIAEAMAAEEHRKHLALRGGRKPDSDATNSVCPHCSGYGSSLKDPDGVNTCTECGGSGVCSETKGGD